MNKRHTTRIAQQNMIEMAWGIIANVNWDGQNEAWIKAAERWRDDYHEWLAWVTRNDSTEVEVTGKQEKE
jgi:hypothetical protein